MRIAHLAEAPLPPPPPPLSSQCLWLMIHWLSYQLADQQEQLPAGNLISHSNMSAESQMTTGAWVEIHPSAHAFLHAAVAIIKLQAPCKYMSQMDRVGQAAQYLHQRSCQMIAAMACIDIGPSREHCCRAGVAFAWQRSWGSSTIMHLVLAS